MFHGPLRALLAEGPPVDHQHGLALAVANEAAGVVYFGCHAALRSASALAWHGLHSHSTSSGRE